MPPVDNHACACAFPGRLLCSTNKQRNYHVFITCSNTQFSAYVLIHNIFRENYVFCDYVFFIKL